ncbi:MAG: hypothetical protein IKX97_01920 [Erysipelotrichaceae bacterium]|nr:hypothetical protein [Erysipelotrichaceae bacterium]
MENNLVTRRTHVSYDQQQIDYLDSISDHEISEGYIFSKLVRDLDELKELLAGLEENLDVSSDLSKEIIDNYREILENDSLAVMFSDERSGSNVLTLKDAKIEGDAVSIEIERERGLTMDMAYTFLFLPVEGKDISSSAARIENKYF